MTMMGLAVAVAMTPGPRMAPSPLPPVALTTMKPLPLSGWSRSPCWRQ